MSRNLQEAIDMIKNNNENYTFLFLTLTQKNCAVTELKPTLNKMSAAWHRWQFMKKNPHIKGYFRSMEITKGADGTAHPHYHAVICVSKSYYSKTYWSRERWAEEWKNAMRLDYTPICDIRKIDMDKNSIKELIKYSVKSSDIFDDPLWFQIVDKQMAKIRRYATGGNIKSALLLVSEKEVIDLDNELDKTGQLYFSWDDKPKDYFKMNK
jgi:plasmid rolling circle replication initiator protein Rep